MKTKTFSDVFSFQQRVSGEYYTCENLKIAKKCFITNEVMENIIFTRNNSSSLFKVRIIYLDIEWDKMEYDYDQVVITSNLFKLNFPFEKINPCYLVLFDEILEKEKPVFTLKMTDKYSLVIGMDIRKHIYYRSQTFTEEISLYDFKFPTEE